jgi:LmbE family N-acetylglucosaminyl deacetylase
MSTLVCFHAHPDDECLATGGTIARASAEGHRVVLVVATDGAHGEVPQDLQPGETLVDRRAKEVAASAKVLGVARLELLGYKDSGMTGWPQNSDPHAFINADVDEAAQKLAKILREENADAVTIYDWHGNYGHPDHIAVYKVGHHAAEIAGVKNIFEMTTNRDAFRRMREMALSNPEILSESEGIGDFDPDGPADDGNPMGEPESVISHKVDVRKYCAQKKLAIACHRSQITDTSFFLNMTDEIFELAFGTEWFIKHGETGPARDRWLFE